MSQLIESTGPNTKKIKNLFDEIEFFTPLGDGVKLHYEFYKDLNSSETRRAYRFDLKMFHQFFSKRFGPLRHPKQVERVHIVAYKAFLLEEGGKKGEPAAPKTIGRRLGSLNTYFKFLIEKGIITINPCEGVRRPRQSVRTETNALTDDQVRALFATLKNKTLPQSLHKAIIYLLFGTGIRVSELTGLKREDFGKYRGIKVIKVATKGGKFQTIPLKHEISKEIEIYLRYMKKANRSLDSKDPLFQPTHNYHTGILDKPISRMTVLRLIKRYCRQAEIFDRVSPHSARATVISSLLEKEVDLYKVSLAVGHSDPATTKKYDKRGKKIEENVVLQIDYFDQEGVSKVGKNPSGV